MEIELNCAILLTTSHRGVFFGRYVSRDGNHVTVTDARNCVRWDDKTTKGFLGLAFTGPKGPQSKVGPKVPEMEIRDVTSIAKCTDQAVEQWESAPWS